MDVDGYVEFLKSQGLSVKGIATRKSKANDIGKITGKDLDIIVADDELMYQTILLLQGVDDSAHTPRQNALRKYYTFINGREFPRICEYERKRK